MSIPLAPIVTQDRVRALAESALPSAPVVPTPPRRHPVRTNLARGLRVIADALEPRGQQVAARPC
jgi:hypothetical protein